MQKRIKSNGGFTGKSITNDQFPLPTPNWNQRING